MRETGEQTRRMQIRITAGLERDVKKVAKEDSRKVSDMTRILLREAIDARRRAAKC